MRREVILVTGANGEMGHGLISHLGQNTEAQIIALDVQPLDGETAKYCTHFIQGDILDTMLLGTTCCRIRDPHNFPSCLNLIHQSGI